MNTDDESLEALGSRARALLEESTERLDGRVRSRLTQARSAAVEAARSSRGVVGWRTWAPAGALAGAAALAIFLWNGAPQSPGTSTSAVHSSLEDLDIMITDESFELLEELEFYEWVALEDGGDTSIG